MKRTIQELILTLVLMIGLYLMFGIFGIGLVITVVAISIMVSMIKEK